MGRKPCPHCQDPRSEIDRYLGKFVVRCLNCRAQGPDSDTEAGAVNLWNWRPLAGESETIFELRRVLEEVLSCFEDEFDPDTEEREVCERAGMLLRRLQDESNGRVS